MFPLVEVSARIGLSGKTLYPKPHSGQQHALVPGIDLLITLTNRSRGWLKGKNARCHRDVTLELPGESLQDVRRGVFATGRAECLMVGPD
jgi:hypothetical protein